jgi:N-acetylglucosamine kinase-like BadF-type ATPase
MGNQLATKTPDPLVIGVDGGGTKTAAWLAPLADDGSGRILGRGMTGPGNPRAAGFDVAQANIDLAIDAAFADAKLPRTTVAAACFGLAGAGRPEEQERIAAWAKQHRIAQEIRVCGDAEPILAAASPENVGIVLIAGTGSLAWGRNAAGETARCGGWGYLLGDEGSGYAIALAGLRAAMRAADGRGPPTDLLAAYRHKLLAKEPDELIARIYSPEMTREKLAELAGIVFEYRSTDEVAEKIIAAGARELAELAATVARRLRLQQNAFALALSGGVLLHQLNYLEEVLSALIGEGIKPAHWIIVKEPVVGAVVLARASALDRLAGDS